MARSCLFLGGGMFHMGFKTVSEAALFLRLAYRYALRYLSGIPPVVPLAGIAKGNPSSLCHGYRRNTSDVV